MEALLGLIGVAIFIWGAGFVINLVTGTLRAAGRTVVGKGSLAENFELAFKGMGPIQGRLKSSTLNPDGTGPVVKEIEVKGLFPSAASTVETTSFVTSTFDETSGELVPVLSYFDDFQEPNSRVFRYTAPVGRVLANHGFITWVRAGVVIPDLIQPPYSGSRKIVVILRMIDPVGASLINHGFHSESAPIFWQQSFRFEHTFKEKGYLEAAENRDKATALSIKLAVILAMPGGTLSDAEGLVLKNWIQRAISPFSGEYQKSLKETYNSAFVEAYLLAKENKLSLTSVVKELNEVAETSAKYNAIELCFDIMSAGEKADVDKLRVIRLVAEALKLDLSEIEKIKDQRIVNLGSSVSDQAKVETLLGIEPHWKADQIKKHLRDEFQKWNNRLNAVEGQERETAQHMLELIAKARKKYG